MLRNNNSRPVGFKGKSFPYLALQVYNYGYKR